MKNFSLPPIVSRFLVKNWKYLFGLLLRYLLPEILHPKKKNPTPQPKPEITEKIEDVQKNKPHVWRRNYDKRRYKRKMPDHAYGLIGLRIQKIKNSPNPIII